MLKYYVRNNDFMQPVYEANFETGRYKLVASRIGVIDLDGDIGLDGFPEPQFSEVVKKGQDGDISSWQRVNESAAAPQDDKPTELTE